MGYPNQMSKRTFCCEMYTNLTMREWTVRIVISGTFNHDTYTEALYPCTTVSPLKEWERMNTYLT